MIFVKLCINKMDSVKLSNGKVIKKTETRTSMLKCHDGEMREYVQESTGLTISKDESVYENYKPYTLSNGEVIQSPPAIRYMKCLDEYM